MKTTAWLFSSLATLCLSSSTTHARLHPRDAAADATGDATAKCRASARQHVVDALHDPHDDLHKLLDACTRPLLFLSPKWTSADQAKAYCGSEKCKALVKRLAAFDACVWKDVPDDSDDALLVAQRVLQDCT